MSPSRLSLLWLAAGLAVLTSCGGDPPTRPIMKSPVLIPAVPSAPASAEPTKPSDWLAEREGWHAVARADPAGAPMFDELRIYGLGDTALVRLEAPVIARIRDGELVPFLMPLSSALEGATWWRWPHLVTGRFPDAIFVTDVDPTSGATWFRLSRLVDGRLVPIITNDLNSAGPFVAGAPWTAGRALGVTGSADHMKLLMWGGKGQAPKLPASSHPECPSAIVSPFGFYAFESGDVLLLGLHCAPTSPQPDWTLVSYRWRSDGTTELRHLPRPSEVPGDVIIEAYPGAAGTGLALAVATPMRERIRAGAKTVPWEPRGVVAPAPDDVTFVGLVDGRPYLAYYDGSAWRRFAAPSVEAPSDTAVGNQGGWWLMAGETLWHHPGGARAEGLAPEQGWKSRPLPVPAEKVCGLWQAPDGRLWLAEGATLWSDRKSSAHYELAIDFDQEDRVPPRPRITRLPSVTE